MEIYRFFDPRDPETGYLSNFYAAAFTLDGHTWPTVEHYFQAQKFVGTPWADVIRQAETPRAAKALGQSTEHPLREDWDEIKQRVMLRALVAKFVQNPELARRLLATRYRMVEASPDDNWWGEGRDGNGQNRLGRLLMALRFELPEADHQNMLVHGDFANLQTLCEAAAWDEWVQDPAFNHNTWYPRLSVNVLTGPFYGQSVGQLAAKLQPLLGKPLASVEPWRSVESVEGIEGRPEGWTLSWQADAAQDAAAFLPGCTLRDDVTHQLARWPRYSVAIEDAPVAKIHRGKIQAPFKPSLGHTPWRIEAVWHLPGPDHDELLDYHYPPVAEALALELERSHRLTRRVEKRYLMIYAKPDEGFFPHATQDVTLHGWPEASPYGLRWQLLTCSPARGALPTLQAEFTKHWEYWGIELPIEDVVNRRAGDFDDTPMGDAGWVLRYRFGRNTRGEYVEIESDHRMCGPENYRLYEDGSREDLPDYMTKALRQQAIE